MTRPRSQIVRPERTRHHHCVARCVRRAWLCGEDDYTGKTSTTANPGSWRE